MLLSEWAKQRSRIEYAIETMLDGIERREGVEFREPKHDIARWVAEFLPEFSTPDRR